MNIDPWNYALNLEYSTNTYEHDLDSDRSFTAATDFILKIERLFCLVSGKSYYSCPGKSDVI